MPPMCRTSAPGAQHTRGARPAPAGHRRSRRRMRARPGATLLEALAALMIVGLLTAIAAPLFRPDDARRAEDAARAVESMLRAARDAAMARGAPVFVIVDVDAGAVRWRPVDDDARGVWSTGEALDSTALHGVDMSIVTADAPNADSVALRPASARVRFHPDGSSDGAAVAVRRGEVVVVIRSDWRTGAVSRDAARNAERDAP